MGYICLFELWFSQGWEDPLEKEMAAHSSTIAWKIHGRRTPWTPWGRIESDMIERLHFHFLFSEYMPKSEFDGSYVSYIPSFLRNLCTVLQASQVVLVVKKPLAGAGDEETQLWSLGREDALEEGMATHLYSLQSKMEKLYTVSKNKTGSCL